MAGAQTPHLALQAPRGPEVRGVTCSSFFVAHIKSLKPDRVRQRTRRAETRCSNVAPSAWALRPADPEPTRQRERCRGTPKIDISPNSHSNFLRGYSIVRPAPRTFLHPDRLSHSRRAQTRSRPGVAPHAQQTPKLPACALTVASTAAGSISGYRRRVDICLLGWAFSAPGY